LKTIDLRSDTVTKPTPAMRQAMAAAEVGYDIYGDDPTVNRLEKLAAETVGKEAALFVPSGSMGNQIALMTHCERGEEVICDADAHVFHYEMAAAGVLSGVQLHCVRGLHTDEGLFAISDHIREPLSYLPKTSLLCLENTLNRGGGSVMSAEQMAVAYRLAKGHGLNVHLDGARVFNAALALQCEVADLACYADSVMFCLSKGLGAPVGSLLVGDSEFIDRARRYRKLLGGGMRQVGVLAAAGLIALQDTSHLADDHANAKVLATGLANFPGVRVSLANVQTNMVLAGLKDSPYSVQEFLQKAAVAGVLAGPVGRETVRFVTHRDVNVGDIKEVLDRLENIF
jgi:threonine aldolase